METIRIFDLFSVFFEKIKLNLFFIMFVFILSYICLTILVINKDYKYIYSIKFDYKNLINNLDKEYQIYINSWKELDNFLYKENNLSYYKVHFPEIMSKKAYLMNELLDKYSKKYELITYDNVIDLKIYRKKLFNSDNYLNEIKNYLEEALNTSSDEYMNLFKSKINFMKLRYENIYLTTAQCFKLKTNLSSLDYCKDENHLSQYEFFYVNEIKDKLIDFQNYIFKFDSFSEVFTDFISDEINLNTNIDTSKKNFLYKFHLKLIFSIIISILSVVILNYIIIVRRLFVLHKTK